MRIEAILTGNNPPEASEIAQEFPGTAEERRRARLASRRAAQAVVDRRSEAGIGNRRNRDLRLWGLVGQVQKVEQFGGRFGQVPGGAQADVAADRAEADQTFVIAGGSGLQPKGFGRRIMAGKLARRLDSARRFQRLVARAGGLERDHEVRDEEQPEVVRHLRVDELAEQPSARRGGDGCCHVIELARLWLAAGKHEEEQSSVQERWTAIYDWV